MGNNVLDFLNIYGTYPRFTVKGKRVYMTTLGYIASIIFVLIILILMSLYFKGQIIKTNPRIETIIKNDMVPMSLDLGEDNFVFLVGVMHPNLTTYIDEKVFSLEVSYIHQSKSPDGSFINVKEDIEITTCDKVYMPVLSSYFSLLPLDQMYCVKNKTGLLLEGDFGLQRWSFLDFKFKQCVGKGCRNNETIDSILKGGYISIYTSDFNIFPSNYKNLSQLYAKNIFSSISNRIYKEMWIYYKAIQFETDDGWFGSSNKKELFYSFRDYTENFDFRDDKDNTFLHIYLRSTKTRYVYSRVYEKIDVTLTKIVCIGQIAYLLCLIISGIFHNDLLYSYICTFYDKDIKKGFDYLKSFNSSNNMQMIHKNTQKILNDSSHNSIMYLDVQENNNNSNYNNNNNSSTSNNFCQNTPQKQDLNNSNVNISGISNSNSNNHNKANNSITNINIHEHKQHSFCEYSNNNVSHGLYTQISNLTHQYEKSHSTKQKFALTNSLKHNNISKTSDIHRVSKLNKISDKIMGNKTRSYIQECEMQKAFKAIQNPHYHIRPFNCLNILKYLICQVDTVYEYKYIRKCYKNVSLYFDVIRFLKLYQEVDFLKRHSLNESQLKILSHNFALEKNVDTFVKFYYKTVFFHNN